MKSIKLGLFVSGIAWLLLACEQDHLIFPDPVEGIAEELIDILVKPNDIKIEGTFENRFIFTWTALTDKAEQVRIRYIDNGEEKDIYVSDFSEDYVLVTEDIGTFDFTVTAISAGGAESKPVTRTATNFGIYISGIHQHIAADPQGYGIALKWQNAALRDLEISIIYEDANGQKTEVIETNEREGAYIIDGRFGNHVRFEMRDDFDNMVYKSWDYEVFEDVEFISGASKSGWSAVVSSNHDGDGGGASALIDGRPDTFWHSPWGGTILPWPHHATVTMDQNVEIEWFEIAIRHNNGGGGPRDLDFQVSENGSTFTTVGEFTNTSTTAGAVIRYHLDEPVSTRIFRLLFKTSINNHVYVNLGEINLFGGYVEITRKD